MKNKNVLKIIISFNMWVFICITDLPAGKTNEQKIAEIILFSNQNYIEGFLKKLQQ